MLQSNQIKKIKIGIDARFYGPKQKGLGRYVQKLVENLEKVVDNSNGQYEFVVFLRKENWSEYQPANPNFKKVLADYHWYTFKEQVLMPLKIWQQKIDLMHFPHFNLPISYFGPFVVTIHDLVLRRFPTRRASTLGPFLYRLKNLAYRVVIYLAIKRAKKIITVSDYTKKDILRYFKVKPDKIEVVYEGAPDAQITNHKSQIPNKSQITNSKLQKFNISKPYLLYVGNAYPHKNLERLILVFKKLVEDEQMDLQLALVGEIDYFYNRLKEFILNSKFQIPNSIILTDFVSDEDLEILYQNASLYVFPSLCEGFGLPPLEAMVFGLPVVSSRAACLPEVLGRAAVYFDPENIEEMAEKIKQVLENKKLQQKLISLGQERIKKYSWLKAAQETLGVYQAVDAKN
jgi:glycosyltransferase involved in cell wall biosynthesis